MANKTYHPFSAAWRDLTEAQMIALPRSPEEAERIGSRYYFSDIICPHNHIAVRYTVSRCCAMCSADRAKRNKYKAKNPESKKVKSVVKKSMKKVIKKPKVIVIMGIKFNGLLSNNKE